MTRETPQGPQRRDNPGAVLSAGDDRRVRFLASSGAVDRHGTIIVPGGIRCENYDRNPVFAWAHQTGGWQRCEVEDVLGRVVAHEVTARGFEVVVEFAEASINPKAERAYRAVQAGLLGAVSIGFAPIKVHWEERPGGGEFLVHDEVDLLEVSLVIVGSNPEAVALRSIFAAPKSARRAMDKTEALKALGLEDGASEEEIEAKLKEIADVLGVKAPHAEPDGDEGEQPADEGERGAEGEAGEGERGEDGQSEEVRALKRALAWSQAELGAAKAGAKGAAKSERAAIEKVDALIREGRVPRARRDEAIKLERAGELDKTVEQIAQGTFTTSQRLRAGTVGTPADAPPAPEKRSIQTEAALAATRIVEQVASASAGLTRAKN